MQRKYAVEQVLNECVRQMKCDSTLKADKKCENVFYAMTHWLKDNAPQELIREVQKELTAEDVVINHYLAKVYVQKLLDGEVELDE